MDFFLGWLIVSFIVGLLGADRNCGFFKAFMCSLILSPLIGLIFTLNSTKKSTLEFQQKMIDAQTLTAKKIESREDNSNRQLIELGKLQLEFDAEKITKEEYDERKGLILKWEL